MTNTRFATIVCAALGAAGFEMPAQANWVTVPTSGAPVTSCNTKDSAGAQSATLDTCKVAGLPPAILPGYVLIAQTNTGSTEGVDLKAGSIVVGTRYDRVYCKGTSSSSAPCDYSQPLIFATRVKMSSAVTDSTKNTHCPVWSGKSNECFEINDFFRVIAGSSSAEVSADIGYFMGTTSGSTDPDTALAFKYLEFAGKTNVGIWKTSTSNLTTGYVAPGTSSNRDATHIMFQADTNVSDPDGVSSQWSPWLFVRQVCSAYNLPDNTTPTYASRFYEGGEEGQLPQSLSTTAYTCKP